MQFKNRIRCECGSDLIKMTGACSFHYKFTDDLVTAGFKVQCVGCDREIVDAIGYYEKHEYLTITSKLDSSPS